MLYYQQVVTLLVFVEVTLSGCLASLPLFFLARVSILRFHTHEDGSHHF